MSEWAIRVLFNWMKNEKNEKKNKKHEAANVLILKGELISMNLHTVRYLNSWI